MSAALADDPRWLALMARGGAITLPFEAPSGWRHGAIPRGQKDLEVGDDRLSPSYCTIDGHRFLRAMLLLPITGARTVFGFDCWASLSEESYQAFLASRAGGKAFTGSFAWLANALPGFPVSEPVACNLVPGPAGQPPRLQPHPGTALHEAQATGLDAAGLADIYSAAGKDITALLAE